MKRNCLLTKKCSLAKSSQATGFLDEETNRDGSSKCFPLTAPQGEAGQGSLDLYGLGLVVARVHREWSNETRQLGSFYILSLRAKRISLFLCLSLSLSPASLLCV